MKDRLDEKKLEAVSGGSTHGTVICGNCGGTGRKSDGSFCPRCHGTGQIHSIPDNPNGAAGPADR